MASLNIPQAIANAANSMGVNAAVALELAIEESGLNQNAVSSVGAIGIMQLLPSSFPGVNIQDATTNINTGVAYLSSLLAQFAGDYPSALAAYNWGPGNVNAAIAKYGGTWFANIPASVQNYVATILTAAGTQYSASIPIDTSTPAAPAPVPVDDSGATDATASDGSPLDLVAADSSGMDMSPLLIAAAVVVGFFVVMGLTD